MSKDVFVTISNDFLDCTTKEHLCTCVSSSRFITDKDGFVTEFIKVYYAHFAWDHYLVRYYILRHVYHTKTKNSMYSRTCLFPKFHCYIPNVNNR